MSERPSYGAPELIFQYHYTHNIVVILVLADTMLLSDMFSMSFCAKSETAVLRAGNCLIASATDTSVHKKTGRRAKRIVRITERTW